MPNADSTAVWTHWPVGSRVVVRRRLAEGGYSDVVGELISTSTKSVTVRSRRLGVVTIPAEIIAIGKVITPPQ